MLTQEMMRDTQAVGVVTAVTVARGAETLRVAVVDLPHEMGMTYEQLRARREEVAAQRLWAVVDGQALTHVEYLQQVDPTFSD